MTTRTYDEVAEFARRILNREPMKAWCICPEMSVEPHNATVSRGGDSRRWRQARSEIMPGVKDPLPMDGCYCMLWREGEDEYIDMILSALTMSKES